MEVCNLFTKKDRHKGKLTDLNKTKHNSNHKTQQTTLKGEIIQEYAFYVLGFVSANVANIDKNVWFKKLDSKQIRNVEEFLYTFQY